MARLTRDEIGALLTAPPATYFRPSRVIIPPELFTARVAAAEPSLEAIADALAEDMVERARAQEQDD